MDGSDFDRLATPLEARFEIELTGLEREKIPLYLQLLARWNSRLNLTGDADSAVVLENHVFEALWAARHLLEPRRRLADIGSGAGFPGLFLALARPQAEVVLIERQAKRVAFLREAVRRLGVGAEVFEGPAAEYPGWDRVETASIRAVRLDEAVLQPLEQHQVELLWFCSRKTALPGGPWKGAACLPIPGFEHRLVRLLQVGG